MPILPAQRVNYDQIAHLYDEPGRDHPADPNLRQFLAERPDLQLSTLRVLDMGCGTGKQLAADHAEWPDALLVGMDLFGGMLIRAQQRGPGVIWTQGNSARTPFKTGSLDYITNQFSYQHVLDKPGMIAETYRLLKPGGRFVLTNIDPWSMPNWAIYRYFPASMMRDTQDFLPLENFALALEQAGFVNVGFRRDHQLRRETLGGCLDYASQRFRTSQLMVISDEEYMQGVARLRDEVQRFGRGMLVESELCFVTLRGDKAV